MRTLPICPPRLVVVASPLLVGALALLGLFGSALGGAAGALPWRDDAAVLVAAGELRVVALSDGRERDAEAQRGAVREVVARAFDGKSEHVVGEPRACAMAPWDCAETFAQAASAECLDLPPTLRDAALRVASEASGLEVTVWRDAVDGPTADVVVTLHGLVGDGSVGLVVSSTPASAAASETARTPHARRHHARRHHGPHRPRHHRRPALYR